MQPINYIMPSSDPVKQALEGYAVGLNFQGERQKMEMNDAREARAQELHPLAVDGARQGIDMKAQDAEAARAAQAEKAQRQAAYQQALSALMEKGAAATAEDFARLTAEFPQLSKGLMQTWDTLDESRRRGQVQVLSQSAMALKAGNTERAVEIANDYAAAARASGDEQGAVTAEVFAEMAETNPDAALTSLGVALSVLDSGTAERVFPSGDNRTVREVQEFQDGTAITYFSDGGREVRNAAGEVVEGQAAADLIAKANEFEVEFQGNRAGARTTSTNEAEIATGRQAEAAQSLGRKQADFVTAAFDGADKAAGSIRNMETALNALAAGARVGAIDRYLPNITEASASLQNAMDRMGLDVIGSVTFGALSEGEMRLAMETAVPRNLDEEPLKRWLSERIRAQQKLRQALLEQAQFLSDPRNTLQDWAEQVNGASSADDGDYSAFLKP